MKKTIAFDDGRPCPVPDQISDFVPECEVKAHIGPQWENYNKERAPEITTRPAPIEWPLIIVPTLVAVFEFFYIITN